MSVIDGIGNAVGSLNQLRSGNTPDASSAEIRRRFAPAVRDTFQSNIAGVLDGAARGDYDDPDIAASISTLQASLRERARTHGAGVSGGGPMASAQGGSGAFAAPRTPEDAAEEEALAQLQASQAKVRLANVQSAMARDYSGWQTVTRVANAQDLTKFQPETAEEAQALGQRLAVALTEGAAFLEAKASELELARRQGNTGAVAELELQHRAIEKYVLAVAQKVDEESRGELSRGANAANNAGLQAVVGEAVRDGISGEDLQTLKKAMALSQDVAADGKSAQLKELQQTLRDQLITDFMKQQQRRDEARSADERREAVERRARQRSEQRRSSEQAQVQASNQRAAQRSAQIQAMYAQDAAQRRAQKTG